MTPEQRIHAMISAHAPSGWLLEDILTVIRMGRVVEEARELYEESLERNGPMVSSRFAEAFAVLDGGQKTQKGVQE